mgnify:CR=1 FL=1
MLRTAPLTPAADPPPAASQAFERAPHLRQIAKLERLADIGMEIAEVAGRRAVEGGEADGPDPGLTFTRAARAVRLTIALQTRLARDLADLDRADGKARAAKASARRARLHRLVEQAIEADHADADDDEIERLSSDAW